MNTTDTSNGKTEFETMLKRFSNVAFDCEAVRRKVTECKAYVTACRVTAEADEPDAHKYNLALLAMAMQTHGFNPPNAADLDAVTTYLDNIDRGATEIGRIEQDAVRAVMQLPFVFTTLGGGFPDGMKEEIGKTTKAAGKELAAANILQREIVACQFVCDIERIAERWIKKGMDAFRTICAFGKQGGAGSVQADNEYAAVAKALTNLTTSVVGSQADEKNRHERLITSFAANAALIKAGFKTVIENQPQTIKAAREWGAAQAQKTHAKATNKAARNQTKS